MLNFTAQPSVKLTITVQQTIKTHQQNKSSTTVQILLVFIYLIQVSLQFCFRRTKWKKQNPGLDVNCGTLPSPPGGPCPFPYPSLFQSSPSEVGFYGAAVAAAQVTN